MRFAIKPWVGLFVAALVAGACVAAAFAVSAQQIGSGISNLPMATKDRVQFSSWWPTKGAASRDEYVGPSACAVCHPGKAAAQKTTPMGNASSDAAHSEVLRAHEHLTFRQGPYHYEIVSRGGESIYSATDGAKSVAVPLGWALGFDQVGQTYVYQLDGKFYEGRVSYYRDLQGLDVTPGHVRAVPSKFEDAAGRLMDADETQHCFGCHSTASTTNNRMDLSRMIPGVTCESCHGPGAKHVAAMQAEDSDRGDKVIFTPHGLSPVAYVEFCGACHRTKWDVAMSGITGTLTVRFQPYRLETSKCWGDSGDARLTCFSCHDPHKPLVRDAASYDDRCLKCHILSKQAKLPDHAGAACPVSDKNCVSCHMPKTEIPDLHSTFTDHRIRIVHKGEAFPG
ncbi:MAG: multiheme c-type cytochrome [Candidatus Acidiferrales bacterium]